MRAIKPLSGWEQLQRHLREFHDLPDEQLDNIDSDGLRMLHSDLHSTRPSFNRRTSTRSHVHVR